MKIITVSNPEYGDKPTIYAAQLKGMDYLKSAIHKALHEGARVANDDIEGAIDDAAYLLRERGYYWYDMNLLIEIIDVADEV